MSGRPTLRIQDKLQRLHDDAAVCCSPDWSTTFRQQIRQGSARGGIGSSQQTLQLGIHTGRDHFLRGFLLLHRRWIFISGCGCEGLSETLAEQVQLH